MRPKLTFSLLVLTLLAACTSTGSPTSVVETPGPTSGPTLSPAPAAPLVILILPADMPQEESDQYQTLIYNLAQANGMRSQPRNSLSVEGIQMDLPALKIVVALPPDPGLAALAAAAPGVQFLAVGIPDLPAAPNLSTVGASGLPVDQQAFLAGYIAGMVAPEWRVGILSQRDTPDGEAARTGFENGYHFYCGDCFNPNFNQPNRHGLYPIIVRIPLEESEGNFNGYADLLLDNQAKVTYVYAGVATPEVLTYMAQYGMMLIGQNLPGEDIRSNWVVSIQPDLPTAIQRIFPDLAAGRGGQIVPTPLLLNDINTNLLDEGKLRLVQETLAGLQNGAIGTGVTP